MEPADVPDNLQHEIIKLESNNKLKAADNNLPLLKIYQGPVHPEDFPILRHALSCVSRFETIYCQVFDKLTLAKTVIIKDWPKPAKPAVSSIINTTWHQTLPKAAGQATASERLVWYVQ